MKEKKLSGLHFLVGSRIEVLGFIVDKIQKQKSFVVLPTSLNDLASLEEDNDLKKYYQAIDFCITDGMPLVWYFIYLLRSLHIQRLYGPDVMKSVIETVNQENAHFFYGSSKNTLQKLNKRVTDLNTKINISGMISPPYRKLSLYEEAVFLAQIRRSKANILWIGLSSPKQVKLAVRWRQFLPNVSIFCVGAAFDFIALQKPMAPKFIQNIGFEWLFRLLVDPKRLWRRYLFTIPKYILTQLNFYL